MTARSSRLGSVAAALSALILLPRAANADALSLRGVDAGPAVQVVLGHPGASIGAWITPTVGLSFQADRLDAFSLAAGVRSTFVGRSRGWGWDFFASGGVGYLRWAGMPSLEATLGTRARWRSDRWHVSIDVVSPISVQLGPRAGFAVPVALEFWFAGNIRDRVWLGVQASGGVTFYAPSASPGPALQAALFLSVPLRR